MDAKTRFLAMAALTYATTAPATAAHLQMCCNELSVGDKGQIGTPVLKGACPVCGSILVPGLNGHIMVAGRRSKVSGNRPSSRAGRAHETEIKESKSPFKSLRYVCAKCGRFTETALSKPGRTKASSQHKETSKAEPASGSRVPGIATTVENRPRNRKKRGLKALLAEAKGSAGPSPSLDLMDFMKSA